MNNLNINISQSSSNTRSHVRALVLPGGGSRGAYQVGVTKALLEAGITFNYIFGTSIGGLNATMIAQNCLFRLEELWCKATSNDIFLLPSASQIGNVIFGHKLGLLDTKPLENLLWREIDLDKLRNSNMKAGWCTTDMCSLETKLFTIDDITSIQHLISVLMATAAIPVAFPPQQINGEGLWVDGGIVKNTPLDTAIKMGADEIYMVLLHPEVINECPTNVFKMLGRCFDVVLDASARREIESAELFNRLLLSGSDESKGRRHVSLKVFQPKTTVNASLLEIDPIRSKFLIETGYKEGKEQLLKYLETEYETI